MPAYGTQQVPYSIAPGDSVQAITASEQVEGATPYAGERVALAGPLAGRRVRFEIQFGGAPGVFEVDAQEADTDTANAYQTVGSVTQVNANNWCAIDLVDTISGKFVRPYVKSLANNVTVAVKVSQQ